MNSNPFVYPKTQHRRKLQPPVYTRYQSYKRHLKEEFQSQCVYCRLPDGVKGQEAFGADHYRPKSKFPELETDYINLFYACNGCNRRKGTFWPTDMQLKVGELIPNPCDYVMFRHLRYQHVTVEPRTHTGNFAVDLLMLNSEDSLKYRELMLYVVKSLEEDIQRSRNMISKLKDRIAKSPENASELEEEITATQNDIEKFEDKLMRVLGQKPVPST